MKAIVVGFDGSDQARDALSLGAALSEIAGGRLIVAVVDEVQPVLADFALPHGRDAVFAAIFDQASEQLGETPFERKTIWGSVPEGLDVIASEVDADLLVVGSTHRGAIGRVLPGSVGERLLAGAPCAVALAPKGFAEQANAFATIGVGYDGEEESKTALALALELARLAKASLRLIAVTPPIQEPAPGRISGTAPGYAKVLREHFAGELEAAAKLLDPAVESERTLLDGDPAKALCEQSAELDLLVLGSRGYGPLRRVLLGGVASRVLRNVACPVIVTPRSSEERWRVLEKRLASTVF